MQWKKRTKEANMEAFAEVPEKSDHHSYHAFLQKVSDPPKNLPVKSLFLRSIYRAQQLKSDSSKQMVIWRKAKGIKDAASMRQEVSAFKVAGRNKEDLTPKMDTRGLAGFITPYALAAITVPRRLAQKIG